MDETTTASRTWTADAFLEWCTWQMDERWDLVGGVPSIVGEGSTQGHGAIVVNLIGALRARLRGTPCRPFTGLFPVQTGPDGTGDRMSAWTAGRGRPKR